MTPEENDKLTRVEGNASMGQLVRRFWIPFLTSDDLPAPDCDPVRVKLLGEDLLAFRDTDGRVGLVDPLCAHRCAALFFGRNEEGCIRCIYHGWKYDVTGQCVDAPTEPKNSNFALTVRIKAYPVEEKSGVLWTYMGPRELKPPIPSFEFLAVPEDHLHVSWSTQDCNFVQAIEGGIDTVHSVYLHSTLDSHRKLDEWKQTGVRGTPGVQNRYRTKDNPPLLFAENTDYGTVCGGKYAGDGAEEDYWRYNLYLMPFFTMPPGSPDSKLCHAFVPLDDHTSARWSFTWKLNGPYSARDKAALRLGSGVHSELVPGTHVPMRRRDNDYLIDREEQRTLTYTGIHGTGEQDFAVQEGMGQIVDRSRERLGVTDGGISLMRQRLLKAATDIEEGAEPACANQPAVFKVHAGEAMLPPNTVNWANHENAQKTLATKW